MRRHPTVARQASRIGRIRYDFRVIIRLGKSEQLPNSEIDSFLVALIIDATRLASTRLRAGVDLFSGPIGQELTPL
jgi:hypothetical protein